MYYAIDTENYRVDVDVDGEIHIQNGSGRVSLQLEDFHRLQEDVRALVHLRKARGDWDEN